MPSHNAIPLDVDELVHDYRNGASGSALATKHNVALVTVLARLRKAGVTIRTPEQQKAMTPAMNFKDFDLSTLGTSVQLVGAIYQGDGRTLLCHFEPYDPADRSVIQSLRMTRDDWTAFMRQADLVETEVLSAAPDGKLAKAILRKSQRQIDSKVSWAVYKRDNYSCRYCGADDTPLTVDHLVLWEHGGPSIEANLLAVDRRCNRTRGNLAYAQWLEHPYYKRVSAALTEEQRKANRRVLATLDAIPRVIHKRSR